MTLHDGVGRCGRTVGCVAAMVLGSARLGAQEPASPVDPAPTYDTFSVVSRALGETRSINVHLPAGYDRSPAARFPALYMPDGGLDEDFPHVVHTVDSLAALGRIRPVIIVGIPNTERRRDLTGPTRVATDSQIAPHVGGSVAFRRFIREELIPAVSRRYRATGERSIVGESLAGLFIVESFLADPGLFRHYVAFDPSLWWNHGALVLAARARLAALGPGPRSLFLTSSSDDIDQLTTEFAALLRSVPAKRLQWTFAPRSDLTHGTIFRAMAPTALGSALR